MSVLRNIIVAGATGSVGAPILSALLEEPSFNVTILSRASSSAAFPAHVPVKRVSDAFTVDELTEAFKGQDAAVVAISTIPVTKDDLAIRLIDAAVAAGIKRFIPSEFGTNNLDPRARKLVPVYDVKGATLEYLQKKASESGGSLTWTSFACGSWLDWALVPEKSGNFLYIDVKNRKATIWDSGNARFAITSSGNTGLAVVRALLIPSETANKQIFLSDFMTTPNEIVKSLERHTGQSFEITAKQSSSELKALREKFDAGDSNLASELLRISFVGDVDVGYDFEKEQKIWNKTLDLPENNLDEVIKEAIKIADNK